jgi:chaperone required for assembly of F1-ATPase
VLPIDQPPATIAALRAALLAHDPFRLAALTPLVTIGGSLVAALALAEDAFTADALWDAVSLDELYQERRWGADSEAQKARARREADWHHAARFLSLL